MIKRSEMRASCYGPGARGLPVNVRVNAHILPRTRLMHTHTHIHTNTQIYARVLAHLRTYMRWLRRYIIARPES